MQNQDPDTSEDPSAPSFLLQNLEIASSDCFADSSHNSAARNAAAQIVSAQIGFYVGCLLRGFESRAVPRPPAILVIGAGFMGSSVLELLMSNNCSPFLHVYCRGDLQAQQWRRRGLKSSPSLVRLMKDAGKADIIVICTGLSGFSNTVKLVSPFVTPATCIITSSFGLQRKRIHASLHTAGVFRTYLEPHSLVKHVRATARAAGIDHKSFDDPQLVLPANDHAMDSDLGESGHGHSPGHGGTVVVVDDDDSVFDDATIGESIVDSIRTFKSAEQFLYLSDLAAGDIANAADLLAWRTHEIKNLVTVMENYFSLLGMRFAVCRAQAMFAVLGYVEDTIVGHSAVQLVTANMSSAAVEGMMRLQGKGEDADDDTVQRDAKKDESKRLARTIATLSQARASLEANVLCHFQRQFSKYIRVVDMPKLSDYVPATEERKSRRSTLRRTVGRESTGSDAIVSGPGAAVVVNKPYEAAATPALQQGHGPNNTMHSERTILHIFSRDVNHRSQLWEQLDANENSTCTSHDSLLLDTLETALDSLDEVSTSAAMDKTINLLDGEHPSMGAGANIDPTILLAIELANAHKKA